MLENVIIDHSLKECAPSLLCLDNFQVSIVSGDLGHCDIGWVKNGVPVNHIEVASSVVVVPRKTMSAGLLPPATNFQWPSAVQS